MFTRGLVGGARVVFTIAYVWSPKFIIVLGVLTPILEWHFIAKDSAFTWTVPLLFDLTIRWKAPKKKE